MPKEKSSRRKRASSSAIAPTNTHRSAASTSGPGCQHVLSAFEVFPGASSPLGLVNRAQENVPPPRDIGHPVRGHDNAMWVEGRFKTFQDSETKRSALKKFLSEDPWLGNLSLHDPEDLDWVVHRTNATNFQCTLCLHTFPRGDRAMACAKVHLNYTA